MEAPDTPAVQDVAAAAASLRAEIARLDLPLDDVIDYAKIAYETAIPEATVRKLFAGAPVSHEDLNRSFWERLKFLRETRRRSDGKVYTASEIATAVGASKEMVAKLLSGERKAGLDLSASLETFFRVDAGFFTISGAQALLTALTPTTQRVELLSLLRGRDVQGVAARGGLTDGSDRLTKALRAEIAGRTHAEDPDISEIAMTVRSLPAGRRSSVLGTIKSVLGLVKSED